MLLSYVCVPLRMTIDMRLKWSPFWNENVSTYFQLCFLILISMIWKSCFINLRSMDKISLKQNNKSKYFKIFIFQKAKSRMTVSVNKFFISDKVFLVTPSMCLFFTGHYGNTKHLIPLIQVSSHCKWTTSYLW